MAVVLFRLQRPSWQTVPVADVVLVVVVVDVDVAVVEGSDFRSKTYKIHANNYIWITKNVHDNAVGYFTDINIIFKCSNQKNKLPLHKIQLY